MGGLQVPGDRLIARLGPRMALTLATFVAAAGCLVMALPCGFASLCIGLVIAGLGSSAQHPRASLLVTNTYGRASRGPLGIYDFAGDLGKATFPAAVALLLPVFAWRPVVAIMALVGIVCNRPGPCAKRRHRPWIRAVLHGRHRRRRACADRLGPHCRSFQSDRRNHGRGIDRRLHHTSDYRASAHLTKRAERERVARQARCARPAIAMAFTIRWRLS